MSDIISRYHPSELLWKIFSIEHVLLYVEYFTLIVMAISVYLAFVYIIQMYRRSVARAVVLNFFRDYPNEIMSAFGAADLKGEVRRILEQAPPHQDVAHTQVEDNGNEKRSVLAIKINLAAEKKIRRNLHKFNQFSGPIYPSYRLADDDIIVYHYVLEKLKEPSFLYKVRDAIKGAMVEDVAKLRYIGVASQSGGSSRLATIIDDIAEDFIYMICRRLLNLWN